jgi:hypothetical protein
MRDEGGRMKMDWKIQKLKDFKIILPKSFNLQIFIHPSPLILYYYARSRYSPVLVSTLIISPGSMKRGT